MYQAYGAAWALSVYLEAIEKEYTAVSKIEYTSTQTIRDSTGLLHRSKALFERCQPAHWASVLLTAGGFCSSRATKPLSAGITLSRCDTDRLVPRQRNFPSGKSPWLFDMAHAGVVHLHLPAIARF